MTDISTFPAIAALVIFCLAIVLTLFLVFKAVTFRIPVPGRTPFILNVKYYTAPVAAVLAMLACTSMSIADVGRGLLGNSQIKPYGILILFMSMAYIAASLDASGLFAWVALKFTTMSGGRGRVLFLFYFLLSSFITTFTSNDVCILTLTPIVCYFSKATGVDPMPYLFAEYAAANTFGALLYTGNPTNIIVAQAYDMTFLGYSKYMSLPTLAAGVACFLMLLLEFHRDIPASIPLPTLDATHMLRDKLGAVVGSVNMLACLALLAAAPSLGWEMWAITLVCAGIHCVYNLWAYRSSLLHVPIMECWTCGCKKLDPCDSKEEAGASEASGEPCKLAPPTQQQMLMEAKISGDAPACKVELAKARVRDRAALSNTDSAMDSGALVVSTGSDGRQGVATPEGRSDSGSSASASEHPSGQRTVGPTSMTDRNGRLAGATRAPAGPDRAVQLASVTPGPVAEVFEGEREGANGLEPVMSLVLAPEEPARLSLPTGALTAGSAADAAEVITVESLRGKTPTFWALFFDLPWEVVPFALGMFVLVEGLNVQGWLQVFGSGLGQASQTLPGAIFVMGFLSVFLANTINNQPMTILLTRVALDPRYTAYVGFGNTHKAALFALVLGSNIGAIFTIIGALAGILWSNIMLLHGRTITYAHFARVCCPVGFATLVTSLLVLWFEMAVFPHDD